MEHILQQAKTYFLKNIYFKHVKNQRNPGSLIVCNITNIVKQLCTNQGKKCSKVY